MSSAGAIHHEHSATDSRGAAFLISNASLSCIRQWRSRLSQRSEAGPGCCPATGSDPGTKYRAIARFRGGCSQRRATRRSRPSGCRAGLAQVTGAGERPRELQVRTAGFAAIRACSRLAGSSRSAGPRIALMSSSTGATKACSVSEPPVHVVRVQRNGSLKRGNRRVELAPQHQSTSEN